MKNKNRGITLISLVAAIVIALILGTVVVTNVYTGSDYKKYKLMCADIDALEEGILIYYNKYRDLPKLEQVTQNLPPDIDLDHLYYKIDVGKLSGITLNFSKNNFIVDSTTFEVYFLDGLEYNGVTYYTN